MSCSTKVRLIGALGALLTAVIGGTVGWRAPRPRRPEARTVELRSTAAPMETTMKSPIVATTDPSPFDPCEDIPFDVLQRLGLGFTPPEHEDGLRCHFDAGNYQVAVEPIIWRTYEKSLPRRRPRDRRSRATAPRSTGCMKPTYHNSYWFFSCMVVFKTSYGVHPAGAVLLDGLLQPRRRLHVHQPAAGQRPRSRTTSSSRVAALTWRVSHDFGRTADAAARRPGCRNGSAGCWVCRRPTNRLHREPGPSPDARRRRSWWPTTTHRPRLAPPAPCWSADPTAAGFRSR